MKKIVSLIVALAMALAMVPFGVFAAGTEDDPVVITDISSAITADLTAANGFECYYTWTADKAGTLQVIAGSANTSETYEIIINDEVYVIYDMEGSYIMDVAAGDEVSIYVCDDYESTIVFYLNFQNAAGAEDNPIYLSELENTVTISGITYYQGKFSGSTMVVTGNGAFSVVYNGTTIKAVNGMVSIPVTAAYPNMPISFAIDGQGEFKVNFEYPAGHYMNPAELVLGTNTVAVEAGSEGYYYSWIAEEAGVLTVTVSGDNWTYIVNNIAAGTYGATYCYNDDPVVDTDSVTVSEGDMIQIVVNTFDPNNFWSTPGGTVTVTASFEAATDNSAENPILVDFIWNEEYTEATATVTVPVGTYYYGQYRIGGMILSINGGEGTVLESVDSNSPTVFSITNNGEAAAEYTLKLTYPIGDMSNPDTLIIGENTAVIAAGSWGYFYNWTAEASGELTITMPSNMNWSYVVNNMTSYDYGDTQWSDSDPVMNTYTVAVSKGDEIEIIVNTYDPNDMWSTPAGTLVITAAFEGSGTVAGDLDGDGVVNDSDVALLLWHTLFEDDYKINGNADFNDDGLVNDADVAYLLWHILFPDDYPLN